MNRRNLHHIIALILLVVILWPSGSVSTDLHSETLDVLIIEETDERDDLDHDQVDAINSTIWRKAVIDRGGRWKVLDPDAEIDLAEPWVKRLMAVKRDSVPWLVVASPEGGTSETLPPDLDALMERIGAL